MTRIPITGSKVHRVWRCPASAALPQIDSEDDGHEPARRRGQAIHRYLERVHQVGEAQALVEATELDGKADTELLTLLKALDLEALPVHLATEVSFAWNWRTRKARHLGRNLDRQYHAVEYPPDYDTEIPCTFDLVGEQEFVIEGRQYRRGYIGDYKSGHSALPAPEKFGQLLLGAVCARDAYQLDDCVVELLYIHRDGTHHRTRRTVDEWDLDLFCDDLADAMDRANHWEEELAAGRGVDAHEGPHCDHCPAYKQCPAKMALVRQIPAELVRLEAPGAITVRTAAEVWMALERIEEFTTRAKQEICGMAAHEEIELPDGRVIGLLHTERRVLDGEIAAQVLEERYGRQARDEAVDIKVSMDALRRAVVRRKKEKEKIETRNKDGVLDRVLAEIERRGGVAVNTTDSIKPHVPRKRLAK